jgi:hypothetical protein
MGGGGIDAGTDRAGDSYDGGRTFSKVLLLALLLLLDGSTLLAFGASVLVDLGAAANLAKMLFNAILVLDVLALNAIVFWLLARP